jgi:lipopolysaccharide heptosyltransferase II
MVFRTMKRTIREIAYAATLWITSPRITYFFAEPIFWLKGMRWKKRVEREKPEKVLVIRLDELGDVVLTSPFLRELRRGLSDAWITLVVSPSVRNLVELCPYVNEVLTYEWKGAELLREFRLHGRAVQLARKRLWSHHFDLAIVPRWDTDSYHASFLAYFSGARWRVGSTGHAGRDKKLANRGYDSLFTRVLNDDTSKHEVERNLDFLRFLGFPIERTELELWIGKDDRDIAKDILKSNRVQSGALIFAFAPGAGHPKRMWPIANFVELGSWLRKKFDAYIMVFGGKGEESLGSEISQQLGAGVINLVGKTTLRQAAALMEHCCIYVGNDSGMMHVASAAGVPVVEISCHPINGLPVHHNSPRRFGPWGVPHSVLQPDLAIDPCSEACTASGSHCINRITVEQVKATVETRLLSTASSYR